MHRRAVLARRGGHLLSRQCHLGACCRHCPTGQTGNDIDQQDTRASDSAASPCRLWRGSRSRCRCALRGLDLSRLAAGLRFRRQQLVKIVYRRFPLGQRDSQDRKRRGVVGVTPPPPQEPGRCLGVSGTGSRRIEYPTTLVRGCSPDEHSPMFGVCLTHSAAQAVHALRSGRPRAQGGWVKASCLVREGVPTDRRHAALKQRTTHRLWGTEDER